MPHKYLISGGGTGGHIFPAIAIADELREREPDAQFLFVGAKDKMEMEKVPKAGYEIIGLWISGIQRSLSVSNLLFPVKLISSLLKARSIIKSFNPDAVIGVGGFASGPVLRMSTWMGIPTLIQEQNSFAGITNRWVAGKVQRACVAYDGMEKFFPKEKLVLTGNPVRKSVVQIHGKREEALAKFGFKSDQSVLLIVGGSLGARSINKALYKDIDKLVESGVQVLWQTGKFFKEEVKTLNERLKGKPVFITEFIYEMDLAYAAADLVVSRAGAIAVSELCLVGKPTILVPFPHAAEDHQTSNAMALVKDDAAIHVADSAVNDDLAEQVIALAADKELQKKLAQNIRRHGFPNATESIVNEIESLIK